MSNSTRFNRSQIPTLRSVGNDESCVICHRMDAGLTLIPVDARGRIAEGRQAQHYFISVFGHRQCVRANARRTRGSRRYGSVRKMVYERDGYQCVWCHAGLGDVDSNLQPVELTLDHIIPQSRWAEFGFRTSVDRADNLQTLCRHCNQRKGNMLESEISWLASWRAQHVNGYDGTSIPSSKFNKNGVMHERRS